jgi:hypothetical protein
LDERERELEEKGKDAMIQNSVDEIEGRAIDSRPDRKEEGKIEWLGEKRRLAEKNVRSKNTTKERHEGGDEERHPPPKIRGAAADNNADPEGVDHKEDRKMRRQEQIIVGKSKCEIKDKVFRLLVVDTELRNNRFGVEIRKELHAAKQAFYITCQCEQIKNSSSIRSDGSYDPAINHINESLLFVDYEKSNQIAGPTIDVTFAHRIQRLNG